MEDISGKIVLVTGSTSGLGRQIAIDMLKQGAHVLINGRNEDRLRETAHHLVNLGGKVVPIQGDVTKPEDCQRIVEICIKEYGRLDIVINNAGTGSVGLFRDTIPEAARMVVESNLFGSIYPSYYALPHLIESHGSMLFISSAAAIHGLPYKYPYSMSKMAITALAQSLRIELSGLGVHIGVMYLGFLQNGSQKRLIRGDGMPVPAIGTPEKYTMSMERASFKVIKALRRRKSTIVLTVPGKTLYLANRLSPWLVRYVISKSVARVKHKYSPEI